MHTPQRPAKVLQYQDIKETIENVPDNTDQFLFAISYANGTRVSEAMGVTAEDITWNNDFVYVRTKVLKKRTKKELWRNPPISRTKEKWLANIILSHAMPVKAKWEQNKNEEIVLGNPVPAAPKLIRYCVRTAQRRFDHYFKCTSHSFRHTRATHCIVLFGMNMHMVVDFFRVSPRASMEWAMRYGHLETKDIEKHWDKSEVKVNE